MNMEILRLDELLGNNLKASCSEEHCSDRNGLTILYLTARVRAAECQNFPWNYPVHVPVFHTLETQRGE